MTSCIDRIDKWHIMSETVQYSRNQSIKKGIRDGARRHKDINKEAPWA